VSDNTLSIEALHAEMNQILGMLSGTEVTAEARELAHVRISEISDLMTKFAKSGDVSVYLINLLPKRWYLKRSYASFLIAAKEKDKAFSVTEITGYSGKIDTGRGAEARRDGRGWQVKLDGKYWSAMQVAKDLSRQINGDLPPLQHVDVNEGQRIEKTQGVFISPSRMPAPELLETERAKLNIYMSALVEEGNYIYRETGNMRRINGLSREACDYLGIYTEWHRSLKLREYCEGCGAELRASVVKCQTCGAIRDWDRAFSLGMLDAQQKRDYEQRRKQVA
jgi:hypothetical protein